MKSKRKSVQERSDQERVVESFNTWKVFKEGGQNEGKGRGGKANESEDQQKGAKVKDFEEPTFV